MASRRWLSGSWTVAVVSLTCSTVAAQGPALEFNPPPLAPAIPAVSPKASEAIVPQASDAAVPLAIDAAVPPAAPVESTEFVGFERVRASLGAELADLLQSVADIGKIVLIGPEDNPSLTVGSLILGLVLLGLGYVLAGMISRWVAGRLLTRLGLTKSAIAPLQSITFYVLLATFTMLSLNVLNVPIAVFSFLGGAVAIGAGFGSQNIMNNFISGLILLAERPIRVGDVIQLDGLIGTVAQIGARSTKIATFANHEIIVPNSKLLETNVVNWTLSDDVVGSIINIGVSYGSPTREVERLLRLAAAEHSKVLKDPPPEVHFTDFGADSLTFELRFWVHLRQVRKIEVESDLRFRIDELLADRGIVIAYPQRDVHLNVVRPVEVRLAQPLGQTRAAA